MKPLVDSASVKVMRSHDYCHFEVCLSASCVPLENATEPGPYSRKLEIADIDELRKTAARLADKAVEQYKVAKLNAQRILDQQWGFQRLKALADEARKIPEAERTSEHKAIIKALEDFAHHQKYDYQDDWEEQDY